MLKYHPEEAELVSKEALTNELSLVRREIIIVNGSNTALAVM